MNLVVVFRRPESTATAETALARCADMTVAEARTRLAGEAPRIVAIYGDAAVADALAARLNAGGFLAGVLPAARIEDDDDRDLVLSVSFGADALAATLRNGATRELPYRAINLGLYGIRAAVSTTTQETGGGREFSAGRALLTGGLMLTKSVKKTTTTVTTDASQGFLFVYVPGQPTLALYERRTNYAALGALRQASSMANFNTVVRELQQRAGGARFDGRLMRPAGLGVAPLPPPGRDAAVWKADVAVALLVAALG
jgi:hypothetical protein